MIIVLCCRVVSIKTLTNNLFSFHLPIMNKNMVKHINLPTRTVTRIACTTFALLFSVLLISAFALVNCAVGDDPAPVDWTNYNWQNPKNKTFLIIRDDYYVEVKTTFYQDRVDMTANGTVTLTSSYVNDKDENDNLYRKFSIIAADETDYSFPDRLFVYKLPVSNTDLILHPRPNLSFAAGSKIDAMFLNLCVNDNDLGKADYSNGCSITFDECYSKSLGIDVGIMGSDKAITLVGNKFKANNINITSGNVIFASDTTFNAYSGSDITLTSQSSDDIKITGKSLTFDNGVLNDNKLANVTIGSENNAALKICCEANGAICAESVFISSGRVDIKGTLIASLEIEDSATFSPGNSVGQTTVGATENKKDLTINDSALLLMEIGGTGENANDYLVVNGDIIMLGSDPTIELVLADGNSLGLGESFTAVLTSDNIYSDSDKNQLVDDFLKYVKTSDFTDLEYKVVDGKHVITGRRFTAYEVPEPSTLALLILGASGLLYWRKKNA